jgi:hypothetical protein
MHLEPNIVAALCGAATHAKAKDGTAAVKAEATKVRSMAYHALLS